MYLRNDLTPEVQVITSEVFNRTWQFIERDPVLAGEDRQQMQDQLAQLILLLMRGGERNLIVIANRAIGTLRQQYSARNHRHHVEDAA
jgi:hypothetical protein